MAKTSKTTKNSSSPEGDGSTRNVELISSTTGRIKYKGDFDVIEIGTDYFEADTLIGVYRTMLTSRRLDEKMLNLLKQGKGLFHIGCAGHEATQAAIGLLSTPGKDWFSLYYRDMMMYLMLGGDSNEVLLHHLAKAADPNSGGRQMAEHFGNRSRNILPISSSVGAQFLPAVGAGLALQRDGITDAYVYCSCGDGATSQGEFHEALNWAAREKAPVLFVVQDNGYAISVPVRDQTAGGSAFKLARGYEGLARIHVDGTDFFETYSAAKLAIEHIKAGKGPVCLVADLVRLLPHSSSDNHTKYRSAEELEADQREDPIILLENRLLNDGLLSQEDMKRLRKEVQLEVDKAAAWADAQDDPDPSTATQHVLFEGDLGLEFELTEPSGAQIVVVDAINHALHEEMRRNDRVLVYGEDVAGGKGGVFTATRDLTDAFGPKRCFNTPLAEASIIGTAIGFSSAGYKPVVEIQFGDYIWPAVSALRNQVASYRYRSNNDWGCPMVIRVPVGGYIHGGLCHSQNIEAFFAHMPGFQIAMPSNAADAKGLLKAAIRMEDPVLFMEHKALYRSAAARSPEPDENYLLPFGKARIVREGSDLTIITYGMMVHKSSNAARILEKEGISVEIIDLRTLLPVDMDTVMASVRKTYRALVVYEDHEFLGYGAELAAQIGDQAFYELDAPVKRLAGKFSPIAFADSLERALLPDDDDVILAARALVNH